MTYRFLLGLLLVLNTPAHAQVEHIFRSWKTDTSPGVAVAVLYRGQVEHHEGYGMANLEHAIPITSTSVFDIASVSKQFCAFAIALLADEGKFNLDDDVRNYLPELPNFGEVITIRHVIYHTSGLRDWPGMLALSGRTMEDVISMHEILHLVKYQKALNFIPGTQYSYSNTGYNLLAVLIERVSGQSFQSFMNDHIFAPLGMTQTHFQDDHTEIVPGRVISYTGQSGELRRVGNGLMALGSSSLHTTTEDLLKWVQNFDEKKLGSTTVHSMMNTQGKLSDGATISYGFGLIHGTHRGLKTISHSGEWAGFRTTILRFPDHQFAVIILGNHSSLRTLFLAERVAQHYLEAFMDSPPADIPTSEFLPSEYEGIYDFGKSQILRLTAEKTSLLVHLPPTMSVPAQLVGLDSLIAPALNLTLTFSRNTHGKVTRAFTKKLEAVRSQAPQMTDLFRLEGCYENDELDASYLIHVQNNLLMATGPRGREFSLNQVTDMTFISNVWYAPVIRFFISPDTQTITHLTMNSTRNHEVIFKKGC